MDDPSFTDPARCADSTAPVALRRMVRRQRLVRESIDCCLKVPGERKLRESIEIDNKRRH
jgi:hypothetical protein